MRDLSAFNQNLPVLSKARLCTVYKMTAIYPLLQHILAWRNVAKFCPVLWRQKLYTCLRQLLLCVHLVVNMTDIMDALYYSIVTLEISAQLEECKLPSVCTYHGRQDRHCTIGITTAHIPVILLTSLSFLHTSPALLFCQKASSPL
jgi:hypothetical protein